MKGSFSPKVMEAIKTLKPNPPIAIPWPVVQDDHLLEDDVPSTFNISSLSLPSTGTLLQFPTPTVDSDAGHNELRKRQVMAIGGVGAGAAAAAVVDQHTVPFGEQTGLTKYAPMPKSAGTTIATRSATPQYPPFPYSIATAYLGAPTVQYTDMAYATWSAQSIENTVCLTLYALRCFLKMLTFR
mgnify:CR=1 FL=1|jgi:hypothetical protein